MRWLLFLCCFVATMVWLAPERVIAGSEQAAQDPQARAQALEESLRAVEWYTNEAVRKALQAESTGDAANAKLFGDKAIESDRKARGLRMETAAAWRTAGEDSNARAVWYRAAGMAKERAEMLAKRVPLLTRQWQEQRDPAPAQAKPAVPAGNLPDPHREAEVIYLQAIFLTAQQWAVAADFYRQADEPAQADEAASQMKALLPALAAGNRLQALADDPRLADAPQHLQDWQQGRYP